MSSNDSSKGSPDSQEEGAKIKHRRLERSCDSCRKRKIRCGPKTNGSCASCIAFGATCTFVEPSRKRGPKDRLVDDLRKTIAALEAKLRARSICSICAQSLPEDGGSSALSVFPAPSSSETSEVKHEEDTLDDTEELAHRISRISIDHRHFGVGSHFAFANNVIMAKEQYLGRPPVNHLQLRRALYWDIPQWEKETYDREPHYIYPPKDLISSLLQLYFTQAHPFLPFLHRPSFERSVTEGLYLRDSRFGTMLLSVLAVASRYSDDPRVFSDGHSTLSAGWKFVEQVQAVRKGVEPNIYEVQFYLLMAFYSIGTAVPQASWMYLGLGIRFLLQHGEHRRNRDVGDQDHESELWNRAFWATVCVERMSCAFIGRPTSLAFHDYDTDLPLEVDDEFWDQGFVQPPEKPSFQRYFTHYIQICEILGDAMHRLYGSKKKKVSLGWTGVEWDHRAVVELDSAMNKCSDSIPPDLHWDPDKSPQDATFDQSFSLYVTGRYTEIVIHRPYIHKQSPLAGPSLSICASAARATIHATDVWTRARPTIIPQFAASPVFVSAIVLMMNTLADKRAGRSVEKDNGLVLKAMEILKFSESRFLSLGRLWEMLLQLQSLDLTHTAPSMHEVKPTHTSMAPDMLSKQHSPTFLPSSTFSQSFVSNVPDYTQQQPFGPAWGHEPQDHSLKPGMSIEELLAETATGGPSLLESDPSQLENDDMVIDEELMSMWMAAPADFSDPGQWGAYFHSHSWASSVGQ